MEFFRDVFAYLMIFSPCVFMGYKIGYNVAKKKITGQHETPKVGANKEAKEFCPDCKEQLMLSEIISDICLNCGRSGFMKNG